MVGMSNTESKDIDLAGTFATQIYLEPHSVKHEMHQTELRFRGSITTGNLVTYYNLGGRAD
jgi:hypothetical protein